MRRTKHERHRDDSPNLEAGPQQTFHHPNLLQARRTAVNWGLLNWLQQFIQPNHSRQADAAMLNPRMFDEINAKISQVIADSPAKDIEKNVRALMSAAFVKMDLVTREEFDVQVELLQRTRAKLAELEQRVAELEQRKGA
jgi:BMFP domain-containing protein YqiC